MTTTASTPSADKIHLIQATTTPEGEVKFALPIKPELVESVEAIDLDLMLTTTSGEKYILQQGALLATTNTESKLVFSNGDALSAADQLKRMGVMKPVEGGSFRLASALTPEAADKVTGNEFGLGKDAQDTVAKIEKLLQSLESSTQSNTTAEAPGTNTANGGNKTSVRTSVADPLASLAPSSPPKLSNDTNDNDAIPNVTFSLLAANKTDVTFQGVALSKTEVRQLLGKTSVELTMSATAQKLEFEAGKVDNQLLLKSVPTTTSLLVNINDQQPDFKIPKGLTINSKPITPGTPLSLDVTGMKDNEVPLNLQWEEVAAAADSKFQMTVSYVGPKGETTLKTITFTGNANDAYTLDANGEARQFITSQAADLVVKANDLANTIITGNGDDTIFGSGGADTINGGEGTDTVDFSGTDVAVTLDVTTGKGTGGQADGDQLSNIEHVVGSTATTDTLDFSSATDAVEVNFVNGTTNVGLSFSGFENAIGGIGADTLTGNTLENKLEGGKGNDTLMGGGGADTLMGGDNDDLLIGGAGADSLNGGEGRDTVSYVGANSLVSIDMVNLKGIMGDAPSDADGDVLVSIEHLIGTSKIDTLDFSKTSDNVKVDFINGTTTIGVNPGMSFSSFEKAIGGQGDDLFMGGDGGQQIDGGKGIDTVSYAGSSKVTVSLAGGTPNTGGHAQGDVLSNIENLIGGDQGDSLTGNTLDNKLEGGKGNDTLMGGGGADTLMGGDNDDLLIGGAGADALNGGDGRDTASYVGGASAVSIDMVNLKGTLGDANGDVLVSIEHLIGTAHADILDFSETSDNVKVDFINGTTTIGVNPGMSFSSFEKAIGGKGNDTYVVNNSTPVIEEALNGGTDTVESSAQHTLAANIENLTLTGSSDINGTGNTGNNTILGNSGNNFLVGGAGDDTLNGGGGNDTASYTNTTPITATLGLNGANGSATGDGTDVLINIENLQGGSGNDTLTGNEQTNKLEGRVGNDTLNGGAGDDTLIGGAGADVLVGGDGNDTASYEGSTAVKVSLVSGASNTDGDAQGDTLSGIENLIGSSANDVLTGDTNANRLDGGDGNDRLVGGGGADTLVGGRGDDTFVISNTGVTIDDISGNDTVESSINYTLQAGLDNLKLTGTATEGTGNNTANTITGNGNNNILKGEGGDDTLIGGGGNDTLLGGDGNDILVVGSTDLNTGTFNGGTGSDTLKITASAGATIDLTGINNANFLSIEKIDLTSPEATTLKLNLSAIQSLLDNTSGKPSLHVTLGTNDTIQFDTTDDQTTLRTSNQITIFNNSGNTLAELATINLTYA